MKILVKIVKSVTFFLFKIFFGEVASKQSGQTQRCRSLKMYQPGGSLKGCVTFVTTAATSTRQSTKS